MSAVQIKNTIFAAFAVAGGAVARALGGWDTALRVLVCFMAADYVTGLLLAAVWHRSGKSESGKLESGASFKGLVRKGVVLGIVWVGAMLDQVSGHAFARDTVCLFFIANEGLSLVENTALMGVPWPASVKNLLEVMREDSGGEAAPHG